MAKASFEERGMPHQVRVALAKLGQDVLTARRRRGISQDGLAARLGVSRDTVQRLEPVTN